MAGAPLTKAPRLSESVARYFQKLAKVDDVARVYYSDPDTKSIVANACFKAGLLDAQEDVYQEVCIRLAPMLLDRMKANQQEPVTVYGVIRMTATNICRDINSYRMVRKERSIEEMTETMSGNSDHGDSSNLLELLDPHASSMAERIHDDIDQAKAAAKFKALSLKLADRYSGIFKTAGTDVEKLQNHASTDVAPKKSVTRKKAHQIAPDSAANHQKAKGNKDGEELLALRNLLIKENKDFANMLGLTEQMLCFYMYSCRRGVPAEIMNKTRELRENVGSEAIGLYHKLSETPMSVLVEEWMRMLGIDPEHADANIIFGKKMDKSRTTIWRWRSGDMKPKLASLMQLHEDVIQLADSHLCPVRYA